MKRERHVLGARLTSVRPSGRLSSRARKGPVLSGPSWPVRHPSVYASRVSREVVRIDDKTRYLSQKGAEAHTARVSVTNRCNFV